MPRVHVDPGSNDFFNKYAKPNTGYCWVHIESDGRFFMKNDKGEIYVTQMERYDPEDAPKDPHPELGTLDALDGEPDSFPPTGTVCEECLSPQFMSPSGITCLNGHGGVGSLPERK